MVFFLCDKCNETLKKSKVDAHAAKCFCESVSCVDCSVRFYGDDYRQHTSCITEAERYEKSVYKGPKKGSKATPQELWMEVIYAAPTTASADVANYMNDLTTLGENVPRKEKQFRNYVANSLKLRDTRVVEKIWKHLISVKEATSTATKKTNNLRTDVIKAGEPTQTPVSAVKSKCEEPEVCEEVENKKSQNDSNNNLNSKVVAKVMKKLLKKAPNSSMRVKDLRSQVQTRLGTDDRKGVKRLMEEHLQGSSKKKFKVEGKIVMLTAH